jgi:hypothetical protein
MIRFVSLGSQINDGAREFAFVDTVTMRFLDVGGVQVFEDRADLEAAMQAADTAPTLRTRLLDLLPAGSAAEGSKVPLDGRWRAAARGIPVWPGCREMGGGLVVGFDDGMVVLANGAMRGSCHPAESGPDLSDPDTRSAYVPRLAVARGASPEDVRFGWRVQHPRAWGGEWEDGALRAGDWGCSLRVPDGTPTDLDANALLALVLAHAWPEEKRVSRA